MPGRKSNVSTTSNGADEVTEHNTPSTTTKQSKTDKEGLSVDDLSLPKSMVARLAKGVLPPNTQIHKDALLALHKSATVFVSYLASNSNDNAQASGKKTISPQDVMAALKDAELEGFQPRLEAELKKYNEMQCDKRNNYRRKVKEEKAAEAAKPGSEGEADPSAQLVQEANASTTNGNTATGEDGERPVKKLKVENGDAVLPDAGDDADEDAGEDDQDDDEGDEDGEDDGGEDDVPEEGEESDDEDETMEDALEEQPRTGSMRDEALDDPDSD